MDVGNGTAPRRKLSMVVQLPSGDEYGGVTRVTLGVRRCLLGWTMGPRFC
jgi:hypothetical protein